MTSPNRKQALIQQIRSLNDAIAAEKSAVDQLLSALQARFYMYWPAITIDTQKKS